MSLWEISLRTQYDSPFIQLSREHPGLPFSMWCIYNRELVQVPTLDEVKLKAIEKTIRAAGHVVDRWVEAQDARIFLLRCTCGHLDSPWNIWERADCIDAPPAVFQDGWGYFRVLSFDESRTGGLFRALNRRGPAPGRGAPREGGDPDQGGDRPLPPAFRGRGPGAGEAAREGRPGARGPGPGRGGGGAPPFRSAFSPPAPLYWALACPPRRRD